MHNILEWNYRAVATGSAGPAAAKPICLMSLSLEDVLLVGLAFSTKLG